MRSIKRENSKFILIDVALELLDKSASKGSLSKSDQKQLMQRNIYPELVRRNRCKELQLIEPADLFYISSGSIHGDIEARLGRSAVVRKHSYPNCKNILLDECTIGFAIIITELNNKYEIENGIFEVGQYVIKNQFGEEVSKKEYIKPIEVSVPIITESKEEMNFATSSIHAELLQQGIIPEIIFINESDPKVRKELEQVFRINAQEFGISIIENTEEQLNISNNVKAKHLN